MDTSKTSDVTSPGSSRRHLLINRNFALLWSGQTISALGDFIFNTTLVVWVAVDLARGQAWTPLAVSGIFLASTLPTILLGPLAGVFVDRWNKRQAMIWATFAQAACIALLLAQVSIGRIGPFEQLGILYLLLFLVNTCAQIARPAWLPLTGQIVAQNEQAQAMGLDQGSASLAMLIGPVLAPPLLLAFGPQWALLIDLFSFLISTLTLLFIHIPQDRRERTNRARGSFLTELHAGAVFLFKSHLLRVMLTLLLIAELGAGALVALDIFFVTQNLHTPPALYGVLDTVMGLGTIAGALFAGALGERIGLTRILWASVLALGIGIIVYARLTGFVPALILVFLLGIPLAMLSVVSGPLLLRATPQELLGRVTSLFNPLTTCAMLIGSAIAGAVDSALVGHFHLSLLSLTFGPVDIIFTAAGLLLLISGLYAMLNLRRADPEIDLASKQQQE